MKFNKCLKIAREKAGLTQKELAEKLNIPPQMINRYENSDTEPRIGFVVDVAVALGITLDELMQYKPQKTDFYNNILKGLYIIKETDLIKKCTSLLHLKIKNFLKKELMKL